MAELKKLDNRFTPGASLPIEACSSLYDMTPSDSEDGEGGML